MSMMENHDRLSDLEREVDDQRHRVERRIQDIQDRLSPGQLLDQALRYTKNGGADLAGSFGQAVTANPIPAALLGVSIAWLMMGPKHPHPQSQGQHQPNYPYARVSGAGLQRTRHEKNEAGEWFSHFIDDAGTEYRARADEVGRRTGHFIDASGKKFSGFIDDAGNRIDRFRDEAGNILEDAVNWASHMFQDASEAIGGMASGLSRGTSDMGGSLQRLAGQMRHSLADLLHDQPLVAGALSFAAGAALGAALPPTRQEDELFGQQSDQLKQQAEKEAASLYKQGSEQARELYNEASEAVGSAYEAAKSTVTSEPGSNPPRTH